MYPTNHIYNTHVRAVALCGKGTMFLASNPHYPDFTAIGYTPEEASDFLVDLIDEVEKEEVIDEV